MDLFEDSAQLVKILLEEGIQPLELPRAAQEQLGREGAGLGQSYHHTGTAAGATQEILGVQSHEGRARSPPCSVGTFHPEGRHFPGWRAQHWAWG